MKLKRRLAWRLSALAYTLGLERLGEHLMHVAFFRKPWFTR